MKREVFKQAGRKGLNCALILTIALGAAVPVYAVGSPVQVVAQAENGISLETAISNIKGTISEIQKSVIHGSDVQGQLETLAKQLIDLEKAVKASNRSPDFSVISVLTQAERTVERIEGNESVLAAIAQVRASLGLSIVEETAVATPSMSSNVKGFSDVPQSHWGYNAIMDMVGRGLLNGTTTPDENGIAYFSAEEKMTKSAYIMVAVRVAYQDELNAKNAQGQGQSWWSNAYDIALNHGIITADDPYMNRENMDEPIKREEMAMVLVRTAHAKGVSTQDMVYPTQISDYSKISPYYRDAVRECYTLGILNGTGNGFEPQVSLNRVSACQSFYNLLVPEVRKPTTPQQPTNPTPILDEKKSHGGYVSDAGATKGMIIPEYSRQYEINALSACRFGVDDTGVYVDLAGLKLPDEIAEFKYQYTILVFDTEFDDLVDEVVRVQQGETNRVYLTNYFTKEGIKSVDDFGRVTLTVRISGPTGKFMFSRTIASDNKGIAKGKWWNGDIEETQLDSTQVWQGIGK